MEIYSESEKHQLRIRDLKRAIKIAKDLSNHTLRTLQEDLIIQVQNLETPNFMKQELIRLIKRLLKLEPTPETQPERQSRFCNIL
jgi:hypothetical protein